MGDDYAEQGEHLGFSSGRHVSLVVEQDRIEEGRHDVLVDHLERYNYRFQLDHFTDLGVIGLGDPGGDEDENFPLHRFHRLDQGQFEDFLAIEHDCLGDVLREQPVEGQSVRIEATQLSDEGCADRLARGHVRLQDVQQVADHLNTFLFLIC